MSKQINISKVKVLFNKILRCETEAEVIEVLTKEGYWNDGRAWRSFGGIDSNYSIIGGQSSNPVAALGEKEINSVDTVLENACLEAGIDPRSKDAPKNMQHASEIFFGIPHGELENADKSTIQKLADKIHLFSSGKKGYDMCVSIADQGTGQTPNNMPKTILSLPGVKETNKTGITFQQGIFNMGGSGSLTFCGNYGISLIISKRNPKILDPNHNPDDEKWGFTVTRKFMPNGRKQNPRYQYLAPHGEVLRFESDSINVLPGKYPTKYSKPLDYGTCIKLFEYKLNGLKTAINLDLNYALSKLFFRLAIPIRIEERREGFNANSPEAILSGMAYRLHSDRSENLEKTLKSGLLNVDQVGEMPIAVYVFKHKMNREKWQKGSEISVILNGQKHAHFPKSLFKRQSVGLSWLADDLMVILDATEINRMAQTNIFMNNRENARDTVEWRNIEKSLEKFLSENQILQDLAKKRRDELLLSEVNDDKLTDDIFSELLTDASNLHDFFPKGTRFKKKTDFDWVKIPGKFKGEFYPTFFRLESKTKRITIKCPKNGYVYVNFETDVEDDYLGRSKHKGKFTCTNKSIYRHLSLFSGIAKLKLQAPKHAKLGQKIEFQTKLRDSHTKQEWKNIITLRIVDPEKRKKSQPSKHHTPKPHDRKKIKNGGCGEQEDTGKPKIILVRDSEQAYEDLEMDKNTAVITRLDQNDITFFVNGDNNFLVRQRQIEKKENPKFLNEIFRLTLGYQCFALYLKYKEKQKNNPEEVDIAKKVDDASEGLAMTIFPVTTQLSQITHSYTNSKSLGD
ncbi:hypothetical protein HX833_03780 [Marine Group I thaumarchaeote]|uniref:Uncharacterized protein n=1 Tax=Marine Group I thaumarchaeote TaxID=2511932 RepID=A0A7K4NQC7_9ARCH|nr:hypothetical protein [Marine Group I thaumarchaeote]